MTMLLCILSRSVHLSLGYLTLFSESQPSARMLFLSVG